MRGDEKGGNMAYFKGLIGLVLFFGTLYGSSYVAYEVYPSIEAEWIKPATVISAVFITLGCASISLLIFINALEELF